MCNFSFSVQASTYVDVAYGIHVKLKPQARPVSHQVIGCGRPWPRMIGQLMSCHVVALSSWWLRPCRVHIYMYVHISVMFLSCFCHVNVYVFCLRYAESTFSSYRRKFRFFLSYCPWCARLWGSVYCHYAKSLNEPFSRHKIPSDLDCHEMMWAVH